MGVTAIALHALGIGAASLALYVAARARGDARRAARAAAQRAAVADRPAHAGDRPTSAVGESFEVSEERMPQADRSPAVDGPRADTAEEALADRSAPDLTLDAQQTEGGEALIVRNSAQQTVRLHKVSYGYADPESVVVQTAAVTPNWDLAPGDSSRVLMGSKAVQAGRAKPPGARYLEGCLEVQDHLDREFRIPFRYDLDEMRVTQGAPAEGWL
jgi:hypothetical protein